MGYMWANVHLRGEDMGESSETLLSSLAYHLCWRIKFSVPIEVNGCNLPNSLCFHSSLPS